MWFWLFFFCFIVFVSKIEGLYLYCFKNVNVQTYKNDSLDIHLFTKGNSPELLVSLLHCGLYCFDYFMTSKNSQ